MPTDVDKRPSSSPREALRDYYQIQDLSESSQDEARIADQPKLVSRFYDAVTRLYEFGWGTTFHFAPRRPGESLQDSQQRLDEEIGEVLQLKPGMEAADFGCGVAGPLVAIAKSTGASVTGILSDRARAAAGRAGGSGADLPIPVRGLHGRAAGG